MAKKEFKYTVQRRPAAMRAKQIQQSGNTHRASAAILQGGDATKEWVASVLAGKLDKSEFEKTFVNALAGKLDKSEFEKMFVNVPDSVKPYIRAMMTLTSDSFETGHYSAGISGGILGTDATTGDSFAEVARLYVRVKAFFEELTIQKSSILAGKHYISPGGGIKCIGVGMKGLMEVYPTITCEDGTPIALENGGCLQCEEKITVDNTIPEDVYRCYFLSEQDGEKTNCAFVKGDMAISEMFNAKTGTSNKISNHRYWRHVVKVENDAYTDANGNHYGYIDLSKTECEKGSDVPQAGDEICQFGFYDESDKYRNITRQSAIMLSTIDADAPSIKLLAGIGKGDTLAERFSLNDSEIISFGYDYMDGNAFFDCYGDTYIGDRYGSTFVKYNQETKQLDVKARLNVQSTIGEKNLNDYVTSLIQEDIEEFVNNILDPELTEIHKQIDGVIETWFVDGAPTLTTYPASGWATDTDKDKHLGDLYFDNTTGLAYRFSKNAEGGYYWNDKVDSATAKALAAAKAAQDTADGKRRTFIAQPTPPYDKGDIWVNATYPAGNTEKDPANGKYCNDILRCNKSRQSGNFEIGDWGLACNYTDDTVAKDALTRLEALADDGILTPSEKLSLQSEMSNINADFVATSGKATVMGVNTSSYEAAFNALKDYVNPLLEDMGSNSTVDRSTYNAKFAAYYSERTNIQVAISQKYVDDLEVGQGNFIANGAYFATAKGWDWYADSQQLYADSVMGSVLRFGKSNTTEYFFLYTGLQSAGGNLMLPDNKFMAGRTYTLAFWVKASEAMSMLVGVMDSSGTKEVAPYTTFYIGTGWQRICYTFTATDKTQSDTRLSIRGEQSITFTYCQFTKFVLVEGTKAPEWTDCSREYLAQLIANRDTLKAITDNYTDINGGLILSTFLKLGAVLSSGIYQESAGLKAMLANKDEIAAYFGGTYAEALAGTKDCMTTIYHNGKFKAKDAEITGIVHATGGEFDGYLRTKFKEIEDSDATQISSDDYRGSWRLNKDLNIMCSGCDIELPNSKDYIGSRVLIYNNCYQYTYGGPRTTTVTVQGGGLIYGTIGSSLQNPIASVPTSVRFASTIMEFIGIVDPENANACTWAVLNYNPNMDYYGSARIPNCLIAGRVVGSREGALLDTSHFNALYISSVSRVSQGRYKLTFGNAFASSLDYYVMLQGEGWVDGVDTANSTNYVKATLLSKQADYFEVGISDDETANDGTFTFMVFVI